MSILALDVGAENLNKFYLEQALLAFSTERPYGYKGKCEKLNALLNDIVRDEVHYGVYHERIKLTPELYSELFGETAS